MYRPEGWENPCDDGRPMTVINKMRFNAYEAGADAYAEGLKKEGQHTDGKSSTLSISVLPYQKGTLVFIPDKES